MLQNLHQILAIRFLNFLFLNLSLFISIKTHHELLFVSMRREGEGMWSPAPHTYVIMHEKIEKEKI